MRHALVLLRPTLPLLRSLRDCRVSFPVAGATVMLTVSAFSIVFCGCYLAAFLLVGSTGL